jgi:hypothetical protein
VSVQTAGVIDRTASNDQTHRVEATERSALWSAGRPIRRDIPNPNRELCNKENNMADAADFIEGVQAYRPDADEAAVAGIVKHLGIALLNPQADSALVSASDDTELTRVRESWLKNKLDRPESDADLDAAIASVAETMKDDRRKSRVTFYYLLAEHFNVLETLH